MSTDFPTQDSLDRTPFVRSAAIAAAGMAIGLLLGSLSPHLNFVAPDHAAFPSSGLMPTASAQPTGRAFDITVGQRSTPPIPGSPAAPDPAPVAAGSLEPCWAALTDTVRC